MTIAIAIRRGAPPAPIVARDRIPALPVLRDGDIHLGELDSGGPLGLSLLLDLSDCEREDQMRSIAAFLDGLIDTPREDWHSCLVAIDEAHLFAPFGGEILAASSIRKAATGAVVNLMSRGRKRGLAGVLATVGGIRTDHRGSTPAPAAPPGVTPDASATQAAAIIGMDSKMLTAGYIIPGVLKAEKRDDRRLPQQGGSSWDIEPAELRRFIIDNLERIDIRKVDKFAFVHILTDHPKALGAGPESEDAAVGEQHPAAAIPES